MKKIINYIAIALIAMTVMGARYTIYAEPTTLTQATTVEQTTKDDSEDVKDAITLEKALEKAKAYTEETCWVDSTGITLIVKTDSVDDFDNLNEFNGGLYSTYVSAVFRTKAECTKIKEGYYSVKLTKYAYENHSKGYTKNKYSLADAKAEQIAAMYNEGSTYDKVSNVYNYLCSNIRYDRADTTGEPYSALVRGLSVCAGYAESFQIIMEKLGIESYICTGYINGGPHMWNAVEVDGEYYYLDATFGCTTGLYEQFLLFGTNRRSNIFSIGITDHSYNDVPDTNIDVEYNSDGSIVIVNTETGNEVSEEELQVVINELAEEETKEEPTTVEETSTQEITAKEGSSQEQTTVGTSTKADDKDNNGKSEKEEKKSKKKSIFPVIMVVIVVVTFVFGAGIVFYKRKKK